MRHSSQLFLKTFIFLSFAVPTVSVAQQAQLTSEYEFGQGSWNGTSFDGLKNKSEQGGIISYSSLSRNGDPGSIRFQVGKPQLPDNSCFKYRAEVARTENLNQTYVWDDGKSHWIGVSINPTDMRGEAYTLFQIHAPNEGNSSCDYAGNAISILPIKVDGKLSYALNLLLKGGRSTGQGSNSNNTRVWSEPIVQGQWTDFVFNFTLSTKGLGYFKVWRNGIQIYSGSGFTNVNHIDSCGRPITDPSLRRHNGPHIGIYGPPCGLEPWKAEMATPDHYREALFDNLRTAVGGSDGFKLVDPSNGVVDVVDQTPPSIPESLAASVISSTQINLSWVASTDNVGTTGYKIFKDGVQIGTSATNYFSVTGLSPSTQYTFKVSAFDQAGNNSEKSIAKSATTRAAENSRPTATISNPSAEQITKPQGTKINFSGKGSDKDGSIKGYAWRKEDCQSGNLISDEASFSKSNFSVGVHKIYFSVKDNDGAWSKNCPMRKITIK